MPRVARSGRLHNAGRQSRQRKSFLDSVSSLCDEPEVLEPRNVQVTIGHPAVRREPSFQKSARFPCTVPEPEPVRPSPNCYGALRSRFGLRKERWNPGDWGSVCSSPTELSDALHASSDLEWIECALHYTGCRGQVRETSGGAAQIEFGDGRFLWLPQSCLRTANRSRGGVRVQGERVVKFTLVRHGETTWNAAGILQGQVDTGLNSTGRQQAAAVAEDLAEGKPDLVITSPLLRARETAAAIFAHHNRALWVEDERLMEQNLGKAQGHQTCSTFVAQQAGLSDTVKWSGGESRNDVVTRARDALEEAARVADHIVVCTHSGVISALMTSAEEGLRCGKSKNCGTQTLYYRLPEGKWSVEDICGSVTAEDTDAFAVA